MSIEDFHAYMKGHFYDSDRMEVLKRDFPNILHNTFGDVQNKNDALNVILYGYSIPPNIFTEMFPKCIYTFPWLEKDADGFITNIEKNKYADYSYFDLSGIVCHNPCQTMRDPELEDCLKSVSNLEIDLRKEPTDGPLYKTNQCWIFPESIRGTAAYDVLYYADYLFKFFWRAVERVILRGNPIESVGSDDFLLSRVPSSIDGLYHTMKASNQTGFVSIRNMIHLFALKNKNKITGWREAHFQYGQRTFIANLQFPNIEYGKDEQGIYIAPLKPNIQVQELDGTTHPENGPGFVLKEFFETNYDAIKKTFPIYLRLERIYKIMVSKRILTGQMEVVDGSVKNQLVYVENHIDSIACHGGIKLQPKKWIPVVIPQRQFTPPSSISPISEVVVNVKVARRPLENTPFSSGAIAHSALVLETNKGRKILLEYMDDSKVYMKDFQQTSEWKLQEKGAKPDRELSPEAIKEVMEYQTKNTKYNFQNHNCHCAQEKTRRAIGLKIDSPYNPLW